MNSIKELEEIHIGREYDNDALTCSCSKAPCGLIVFEWKNNCQYHTISDDNAIQKFHRLEDCPEK